jgi:Fe-S oxidoreductase
VGLSAVFLGLLIAISGAGAWSRAKFLHQQVARARPNDRPAEPARRVRNEVEIVLGQRKLLRRLVPGLMHAFIFWGFLVLLPTIVMATIAAVSPTAELPWLWRQTWFGWLVDVFVVLVFAGVVAAVVIRKVVRPDRFRGSHLGEADFILVMIAGVVATLLCWHAAAHAAGLNDHVGPVSKAFASVFPTRGRAERVFVWAHLVLIFAFLRYVPSSKHLHIATAALNVWMARTTGRGRLEPLRFDVPEKELRFGVATIADLTRKEVMDAYTCTECGRCQDACPAWATGKVLSPKLLIMGVRDQVFAQSAEPIVGNGVPEEMIWDCVTCGACVEACPVSIEHVDHIVDLRRSRVMVDARFPPEAEPMLRDVERSGNPWGKPQTERADWAAELGVRVLEPGDPAPEYLYWVGCAASFDERARASAQATARLLQAAGVDFAILGPRESCTGDPARRMGNEYVFQAFAEQNVATLDEQHVRKIVASCPHCFNTLANEYGDFGGSYEVLHHTELLAQLVEEGKLAPAAGGGTVTYHDSCYLARHNDVRAQPRKLLPVIGQPVEMERSGRKTFCCGAGGAHMWMEERGTKQINVERAEEAVATGAETLAVACPFCTVMLDDGVRETGAQMRVADVATLLAESLDRAPADTNADIVGRA